MPVCGHPVFLCKLHPCHPSLRSNSHPLGPGGVLAVGGTGLKTSAWALGKAPNGVQLEDGHCGVL